MWKYLSDKAAELRQSRFVQNMVLTGISLGLYGLTKVSFNIIVLKYYNSELVGSYNLAISGALLVSILISNLFCISLTRFSSEALGKEDHGEFLFFINVNFWGLFLISLVCSAMFYALAPWIASQFGGEPSHFRWASGIILVSNIYNYFKSFSYVIEKVLRYTILEIISSVIFFGALIMVLALKKESLLLVPMLVQLGCFSIYSIMVNWKYISNFSWLINIRLYGKQALELLKYSLITGLGTTASMWTTHVFTLMLGKVADVRTVGYFSVVNSTADPLNFVPRVITMVSFPRVSFLYGKRDFNGLTLFIKRNYVRLLYICSAMFIGTMMFSTPISKMLFGEHYREVDWLLRFMIISRLLPILAVFHIALLSGTNYPAIPNLTGPVSLLLCIPLIPFFYSNFGLLGMGFVVMISGFLRSLPSLLYGEHVLRKVFISS